MSWFNQNGPWQNGGTGAANPPAQVPQGSDAALNPPAPSGSGAQFATMPGATLPQGQEFANMPGATLPPQNTPDMGAYAPPNGNTGFTGGSLGQLMQPDPNGMGYLGGSKAFNEAAPAMGQNTAPNWQVAPPMGGNMGHTLGGALGMPSQTPFRGSVPMLAPDGTIAHVPPIHVSHYQQRGARFLR